MKKVVDDVRLMIRVCDLYYNQSISQQKIAQTLGLSRPTVSRLLSSAREQGIVKITISDLGEVRYWDLERRLEDRYHLQEVLISDSSQDTDELMDHIGRMAGRYVERKIRSGHVVGVSMGRTLRKMVNYIQDPEAEDVTFVPLIGGLGQLQTPLHANSIAESLAEAYHGTFVPLHAPARVSSRKMRDELMKEESLSRPVTLMRHMDIALLGIGYPSEYSSITATGYYDEQEIEDLKSRRVAGDICMQFFDETGDTSLYSSENNVIGADIHNLYRVPCCIGIAGGVEKISAVLGAIRGGYINHLVTDEECARALLEL
ncbi:MAG: sugar-binding transcriptional regulator [Eubacterium sp.]|nr:sugar-binding transcriptional regulator [Eubacterium sp.]